MVDTIKVRYERTLGHPVEAAFDWLTDYRDDDADRAGAIIEDRRVIEETDDRIVLEGQLETLGRQMDGKAVVELDPPDHWRADLYDAKGRASGVYDYRLEPTDDGSRLIVDYNFAAPKVTHKLMFWLSKPLIRRQLDDMWAGFEQAMDEELREQAPA